jgi:hypothetical protein
MRAYRSDSVRGLFVGVGHLRDYSRAYNEQFDGFVVRKFNGERPNYTAPHRGGADPSTPAAKASVAAADSAVL